MRRVLFALLLVFVAPLAVAQEVESFIANAGGTITVAPDGSVADVEIAEADALGRDVVEHFESHIRTWRFDPVLENGQPIRARAYMRLALVAMRERHSDKVTLGIRNVHFVDPPAGGGGSREATSEMRTPRYPDRAWQAGVGAEVLLLAELGENGQVLLVGTERILMLGADAGPRAGGLASSMARAAEAAAADWRIAGQAPGSRVRIPVVFNTVREGWQRMYPHAMTPDPWVVAALEQDGVTELASSGEPPSRLRLASDLPSIPGLDEAY
jgi:hypothetical protein